MSLGQTKSLHNPKFNSRIGARNVFAVPTADQRRQRAPAQPHLPGPTAAAQQLLREASRPQRENRFCGTDLLITMSIQSGFPGRYPLQLRKTGLTGGAQKLEERSGRAGSERSPHLKNLLDDEWSKAKRRLVKEKKLGLGHQPPSDRDHLLLATGQLPTQHIREGFQLGKDSKHLLCVSLKLTT